MFIYTKKLNNSFLYRMCVKLFVFILSVSLVLSPSGGYAQVVSVANLPAVGTMVPVSQPFSPAILSGIKVFPDNPLRFDFIVNTGDTELVGDDLKKESEKLIKYFLTSLTVPENDLWVNLSPYEKDRIIPNEFGVTEMGRDLLAQDYILKQLTASLMYPEDELGQKFWDRIYQRAYEEYGSTEIPVNTFNKVWIVPQKAVVYENAQTNTAFVLESHLKVMLEEDYAVMEEKRRSLIHQTQNKNTANQNEGGINHAPTRNNFQTEIIREIIIPEIEREVNQGENFAQLRQIYNSLILAAWFKKNLQQHLLRNIYVDQNKIEGVDIEDKQAKDKIYQQYLEAFKMGVYNYIKEDYDPVTDDVIPRKYFSGGMQLSFTSFEGIASGNSPVMTILDDRNLSQKNRENIDRTNNEVVKVILNPNFEGKQGKQSEQVLQINSQIEQSVEIVKDYLDNKASNDDNYALAASPIIDIPQKDFPVLYDELELKRETIRSKVFVDSADTSIFYKMVPYSLDEILTTELETLLKLNKLGLGINKGIPEVIDYGYDTTQGLWIKMKGIRDAGDITKNWEIFRSASLIENIEIFIKFAKIINLIHQEGILHLDIGLDNVLINKKKEVLLIDFQGISERSIYRALEPEKTPKRDIYSLGMLFDILLLVALSNNKDYNEHELRKSNLGLYQLFEGMHERDPKDRQPESMQEVVNRLTIIRRKLINFERNIEETIQIQPSSNSPVIEQIDQNSRRIISPEGLRKFLPKLFAAIHQDKNHLSKEDFVKAVEYLAEKIEESGQPMLLAEMYYQLVNAAVSLPSKNGFKKNLNISQLLVNSKYLLEVSKSSQLSFPWLISAYFVARITLHMQRDNPYHPIEIWQNEGGKLVSGFMDLEMLNDHLLVLIEADIKLREKGEFSKFLFLSIANGLNQGNYQDLIVEELVADYKNAYLRKDKKLLLTTLDRLLNKRSVETAFGPFKKEKHGLRFFTRYEDVHDSLIPAKNELFLQAMNNFRFYRKEFIDVLIWLNQKHSGEVIKTYEKILQMANQPFSNLQYVPWENINRVDANQSLISQIPKSAGIDLTSTNLENAFLWYMENNQLDAQNRFNENEFSRLKYLSPLVGEMKRIAAASPIGQDGLTKLHDNFFIHNELQLDSSVLSEVPQLTFSFKEFMEQVLFNSKWGYYASGRVKFGADQGDFSTFPEMLSPFFGSMVAEHAFKMWKGMRQAGTLERDEIFTMVEFGAGNARLAEDFLDFLNKRAEEDMQWKKFQEQMVYRIYERSSELRKLQKKNLAKFQGRVQIVETDAESLLDTIPPESLKGLIFSNELFDVFGAEKVVFSADGNVDIAYPISSVDQKFLKNLSQRTDIFLIDSILSEENQKIRNALRIHEDDSGLIILTKVSFEALVDLISSLPYSEYRKFIKKIKFEEIFIPVSNRPDLLKYFDGKIKDYAIGLEDRGMYNLEYDSVVYINPSAESFIRDSSKILKAGYVLTIDYGADVYDLLQDQKQENSDSLRTYSFTEKLFDHNPYDAITLQDITTDQNFTDLAKVGLEQGLDIIHYGYQKDLAYGTSFEENILGLTNEQLSDHSYYSQFPRKKRLTQFRKRVGYFTLTESGSSGFKILVQQKEGTDPQYDGFPPKSKLGLFIDYSLYESERNKKYAQKLEKSLRNKSNVSSSSVKKVEARAPLTIGENQAGEIDLSLDNSKAELFSKDVRIENVVQLVEQHLLYNIDHDQSVIREYLKGEIILEDAVVRLSESHKFPIDFRGPVQRKIKDSVGGAISLNRAQKVLEISRLALEQNINDVVDLRKMESSFEKTSSPIDHSVLKLKNEMKTYKVNFADRVSRDILDDRIQHFSFNLNENIYKKIETVQVVKHEEKIIYWVEESSVILVRNLRSNERIYTGNVSHCESCGIRAVTNDGNTWYGVSHLLAPYTSSPQEIDRFRSELNAFLGKMPSNIQELQVIVDYSKDFRREKEMVFLERKIKERYPFVEFLYVPIRKTQIRSSMRVAPNAWGVNIAEGLGENSQEDIIVGSWKSGFSGISNVVETSIESSSPIENLGGIDLNPVMLNIETKGTSIEFDLPFDVRELEGLPITGFTPIIFHMAPVINLPLLFGFEDKSDSSDDVDLSLKGLDPANHKRKLVLV